MKPIFVILAAIIIFLNGCASLLDVKYTSEDGKKSPYMPQKNPYEPPRDPTLNM
jgi:uncharacterized protein YceK